MTFQPSQVPMRGSGSYPALDRGRTGSGEGVGAICPRLPVASGAYGYKPCVWQKERGEAGQQWPGRWGRRFGKPGTPC